MNSGTELLDLVPFGDEVPDVGIEAIEEPDARALPTRARQPVHAPCPRLRHLPANLGPVDGLRALLGDGKKVECVLILVQGTDKSEPLIKFDAGRGIRGDTFRCSLD